MIISYALKKESKLKKTPDNFKQIFALINLTQTGKRLLEELFKFQKNTGRAIDFKPYPYEISQQLKSIHTDQRPIGASFITDGKTGTIHFGIQNEIGVLAIQLVHEMAHALDESLWQLGLAEKKMSSLTDKEKILSDSEINAFSIQKKFLDELRNLDPKYLTELKERFPESTELFAQQPTPLHSSATN